ncbi:MAG: YihY/virulence factor BrkB family protein [Ruminococcus sp.]|nr:YihY/virulence factor BrkB family protein [Ruminococcus sp.]
MKKKKNVFAVIVTHVRHFLKKSYRDNISALAGQSTFFLLLSAVPCILFAFSVFSILTGKTFDSVSIPTADLPENSALYPYFRAFFSFVKESVQRSGSGTTIITAIVMLWSAGKGMYCITEGISRVYRLPNRRFWLFKRIYAMGYTVVMMLIVLLCVVVTAVNFFFAGTVLKLWEVVQVQWAMRIILYIMLALLLALMLTLALRFYLHGKLKNKRYCSLRALFPGMLLTVVAWNALTIGVMIYIRYFATSSVYGSLSSVFMLMIWAYFMMYILLYGVQLNYIYRRQFSRRGWFRRKKNVEKTDEADGKELNEAPSDMPSERQ